MSEADEIVRAALLASSVSEFLDVDMAVVSLLETALSEDVAAGTRARLLARLARQLLGDASAAQRRARLIAEATDLAEASGDDQLIAEVLDARLHAMWSADSLDERYALADSIVERARSAGDPGMERQALLWRFTALVEMGRLVDAESALAGFAALASLAQDPIGELVVVSRHAMLATLRGRFDEARRLIDDTQRLAQRIGAADAASLVGTLRGNLMLAVGRDDPAQAEAALACSGRLLAGCRGICTRRPQAASWCISGESTKPSSSWTGCSVMRSRSPVPVRDGSARSRTSLWSPTPPGTLMPLKGYAR